MNLALQFLMYGLQLLPQVVLGIQTIEGDKSSGATKLQMAQDALGVALQGAAAVIPAGTANAAAASAAASVAQTVLTSIGAINAAVTHTKATGAYQAATKVAAAAQTTVATTTAPIA